MQPMGGDGAIGPGGIPLHPGERVLWVGGYRSSFDLDAPTASRWSGSPSLSWPMGGRVDVGHNLVGRMVASGILLFFVLPALFRGFIGGIPLGVFPLGPILFIGLAVGLAARAGALPSATSRQTGGAANRPFAPGYGGTAVHTVATYLITDRRVVVMDERGPAELPLPQAIPTVVHRSAYGGTVVFETAPGPRWGRITMLNQSHQEIGRIQDAMRQVNPQAAAMMPPPPPTSPARPAPPAWDSPEAKATRPDVPPLEVRDPGPVGGGPEPMSVEEQMSRWRRRMAREQDPQPPTGPDPSPPSGPIVS